MHNVFTFEECSGIQISSVDGTHVPAGSNNLVYRSARVVYDQLGIPMRGALRITQRNDIPMARGLGSSSACIVAGILGANALLGNKLTKRQMLYAGHRHRGPSRQRGSGHAGRFCHQRHRRRPGLHRQEGHRPGTGLCGGFVPDFRLLTAKARAPR